MKNLFNYRYFLSILVVLVFLIIQGCATSGGPEVMVVGTDSLAITKRYDSSVQVNVTGGKGSVVTNENFIQALVESINQSRMFRSVVDADGDYQLVVVLLSVTGSTFGMTMEGKVSSLWTLRRDGEEIWRSNIETQGKATPGEAFVGIVRNKIAMKRAAKNAIKTGIEQISKIGI